MGTELMIAGGALSLMWGTAHMIPTRYVIASFGPLSVDNRRILSMEWLAEGVTLAFLGLLAILVSPYVAAQSSARLTARACAGMLVAMAVLTAATGARTSVRPIRFCPLVKLIASALILVGSIHGGMG